MNPSLDLRLKTMLRSLTEVILPALDPENSLAQEQARLLVGHLHAMLLQQPHAARFTAIEVQALRTLAERLVAASAGGPSTMAARAQVSAALNTQDHAALSHAVEALVVDSRTDGAQEFLRKLERLVLDEAKATSWRGRTWFKAMNFDANPALLSDIPTMLDAHEALLKPREHPGSAP